MSLITKTVNVKVWRSLNYYKSLGYKCNSRNDIIEVSILDLLKGSRIKVIAKCDICGGEKEVIYKNYNKHISLYNFYSCYKCCNYKIKLTCNKKYGVDNVFQLDSVKVKSKETIFENFGVLHQMFDSSVKLKIVDTCYIRYGVSSYTKTEECSEKTIATCLERYDVEHPSKTDWFQDMVKKTKIRNGNQLPDCEKSDYELYRRKVNNITKRYSKKILLDMWDGYDYYDGEYIVDNFKLSPRDKKYPTIDHKISVKYGFENDIDVCIISDIDNLCVTKNMINASKNSMCEEEFKQKIRNRN